MRDYNDNDPRGWGGDPSRGAALGRRSLRDADRDAPVRLRVVETTLDEGGYDANGTYFGTGKPLFWAASLDDDEHGAVDFMIRADSWPDACEHVRREDYPNALIAPAGTPIEGASVARSEFLRGALDAILFTSSTDDGIPLDRDFGVDDIDQGDVDRFTRDVVLPFIVAAEALLTVSGAPDASTAGWDFVLSANGSGCGFRGHKGDRWPDETADALAKLADEYPSEMGAYVGDDGKLYLHF